MTSQSSLVGEVIDCATNSSPHELGPVRETCYRGIARSSLSLRRMQRVEGDTCLAPTHQFEWRTVLFMDEADLAAVVRAVPDAKATLKGPGCAGQNVTFRYAEGAELCIGDVVRVGTVLLELTGPRHPCIKNTYAHAKGVHQVMLDEGRAGVFFRVLRSGTLKPGDTMSLLDRPSPRFRYRHVHALLYAPNQFTWDLKLLEQIACLPALGEHRYRAVARKRATLVKEGVRFSHTDSRSCRPYRDEPPVMVLGSHGAGDGSNWAGWPVKIWLLGGVMTTLGGLVLLKIADKGNNQIIAAQT
eukprot:TRINITY_DN4156_c0_g1_i1.p1 TRINITY_DN4156_c0_g1~~TRINITY_DN4156_c0_g1_i1.p1  ORF type:complete len:300 (+),score=49.01 TRINITY_DN4156_c0_g1_i1:8-907(+)